MMFEFIGRSIKVATGAAVLVGSIGGRVALELHKEACGHVFGIRVAEWGCEQLLDEGMGHGARWIEEALTGQ